MLPTAINPVLIQAKAMDSCGSSFLKVHTGLPRTKYGAPDLELAVAALAPQLSSGFLSLYTDGRERRLKCLPFPPPPTSDKQPISLESLFSDAQIGFPDKEYFKKLEKRPNERHTATHTF